MLCRSLNRLIRKSAKDTVLQNRYETLRTNYNQQCKPFYYLHQKRSRKQISKQYQLSITHNGVIEATYKKINRTTREGINMLAAAGRTKQVKALQQEAVYGRARQQYLKKVSAKSMLDKLHVRNINELKQKQQFVMNVQKQLPANAGTTLKDKLPVVSLPDELQTNQSAGKVFNNDKHAAPGTPGLKAKFDEALSNPLAQWVDTGSVTAADTPWFTYNPYRAMPFFHRIKPGFNHQFNPLSGGGITSAYTLNLGYLLTPTLTPVIGLGYEHKLASQEGRLWSTSTDLFVRAGMEGQAYKMIACFMNYEMHFPFSAAPSRSVYRNDLVLGLTNYSPRQRRLKVWIGLRLLATARGEASPFVFRLGF